MFDRGPAANISRRVRLIGRDTIAAGQAAHKHWSPR
jgi:hypothetical protein